VGIVFTGFSLVEMIGFLEKTPAAYYMVISIIGLLFTVLIVWYAWKWPKQET